jgi:hypothetical protein
VRVFEVLKNRNTAEFEFIAKNHIRIPNEDHNLDSLFFDNMMNDSIFSFL